MKSQASPNTQAALSPSERQRVRQSAGVLGLRLLGLFMLLPVVALYAEGLAGATALLVGLAVGIYGLSQALLQWPMGWLSDRLGRKPLVLFGLVVFVLGSVVAAMSTHIIWFLVGRFLQGAGAVSGVLLAWLADGVRAPARTRAMAYVGVTIGASFMLALMLGPLIASVTGVVGLFWLVAVLGCVAMLYASRMRVSQTALVEDELSLALAFNALPFVGIFLLHACMTFMFTNLPFELRDHTGIAVSSHWWVYLVGLLCSLVGTVVLILLSERLKAGRLGSLIAAALIIGGVVWLTLGLSTPLAAVAMLACFFAGFNFLEARWPSQVSQMTQANTRGRLMSTYTALQFVGAFVGGALGGVL